MPQTVDGLVQPGSNFGVSTEVPGRLIGILVELGSTPCNVYVDHNPVSGGNASVFPTPQNEQYRLTLDKTGLVYLPVQFETPYGSTHYNVYYTAQAATARLVRYYYEEQP